MPASMHLIFLIALLHTPSCLSLRLGAHRSLFKMTIEPKSAKSHLFNAFSRAATIAMPIILLPLAPAFAGIMAPEDRLREQPPDRYLDVAAQNSGNAPNYKAVMSDIEEIIRARPDKGPTLLRLAWHSSGTYDKMSKTGGSERGTIRFTEELKHGANAGLDMAISWLEPVYKKYNKVTDLSYADLYTLAGVVAVSALGGPKIGWRAGRVDSMDPADVTPDGRLPEADKGNPKATASHLRDIFYRMGFNDQEIVALSGAHALGRCHVTSSGYTGPWSFTPLVFDNTYFRLLTDIPWTPNTETPKFQYKDPSGKAMMLPSDIVLIEDPEFKKYVQNYSKDQNLFFKDFAAAFQKLEELGTSNLIDV